MWERVCKNVLDRVGTRKNAPHKTIVEAGMAGMFDLTGKVAMVTGGSRGIGRAMAEALAQAGAKVVLAARKLEGLQEVEGIIQKAGGQALAVACHTGKPEQLQALMDAAVKKFGQVDILINNAATNPYFGPFTGLEDAAFAKTVEVNLKGAMDLSRLVAQHLMDRGAPGSIINITSVVGLGGTPLQGAYAITKAGLISMTQTMAVEWGSEKIRVNAIAPGFVKTSFSRPLTENEEISTRALSRTPLGRFGEPEDVAGAAVFLASDASRYITGHVLVVDGGLTAQLM
jgi:NAD(P)-dependent dehydrogenase (short-subunit alcohol dehydrogenase family)